MDLTANHMGFILASYALTAVFLLGLIAYVLLRDRQMRAEAERLERQRKRPGS